MAWAGPNTKCPTCKQVYTPIYAAGSVRGSGCPFCADTAATEKEEKHFAELDALEMEERIRRIEKWIYNYKPPSRGRSGPTRF